MSTNIAPGNLGNIIPSIAIRKIVYSIFIVAGIVIGATQVGYASIEGAGQPTWLTVTLAVYAFLSVPLGSLAISNTPSSLPEAIATVEEAGAVGAVEIEPAPIDEPIVRDHSDGL